MKTCTGCRAALPESQFYTTGVGKYKKGSCRSCCIAYTRARRNTKGTPSYDYRRYNRKKERERKRGIEFSLTKIEFTNAMAPDICAYCQKPMSCKSLDRVNAAKGYLPDNVVVACMPCNRIKSNITPKHIPMLENVLRQLKRVA